MPITFKNDTATPVGLWDVDNVYHVAAALGGTVTLEPSASAQETIDILVASGSGSSVDVAPPVNTAVPTISGTASVGTALTSTNGTWTGKPTPAYTRKWQRGDAAAGPFTDIASATAANYTPVAADAGKFLRVVVTATNSQGSATAESAATAAVTRAPTNTAAPAVSGTAQVGSTLTTTNGTWAASPTPTYARAWQRSANGTSGWAAISGATATTYALVAADEGQHIRCVVTATNSAGNATANSNVVGPVAAGA